jgi:hypothetical protein
MQTFKINNATIDFTFIDDNNFIIIVADTKLIGNFTIMFNDQQFLHFLSTNGIVEVQDDVILWDEYVEDEAGITHMNTHGIKVHDYINNYISRDVIESVIIISLEEFVNNFQP